MSRNLMLMFFCSLLYLTSVNSQGSPMVQISTGQLRGTNRTNFDGGSLYAFLNIPFAKPPVGNWRFRAPQPAEPWRGVRDATQEGPPCLQFLAVAQGAEDCLSLHVFTKSLPSEEQKLKPVVVFIPGGAFISGSNTVKQYGSDFLLTEDIVLVTIQYRLGIFGFLSLEDSSLDVPGNAGLKDQILALKWVQENIRNFNGDPNVVTLAGQSAGSKSVEYLMLSPSASGLFQKAIMESGTTLTNWARGILNPADFAEYLGHSANISQEDLLTDLQAMSASDLISKQFTYSVLKNRQDGGLYGPVIEKPNPTAVITEHPIDIIQSGNYSMIPVIIGFNTNEGLLLEYFRRSRPNSTYGFEWPVEMFLPRDTDYNDPDQVKGMTDILTEFYGRPENINDIYMMPTDGLYIAGIIPSVINYAAVSRSSVYLYRFSLEAGLNMLKVLGGMQDLPGACHADELGYLFTGELLLPTGEVEITAVRRMVKLWTNFAKYSNPTPDKDDLKVLWSPATATRLNYLDIGEDLVPSINPLPESERMECWKRVYQLNNITAKFFL